MSGFTPLLVLLLTILPGFALPATLNPRVRALLEEGAARFAVWGVYAADLSSGDEVADVNGRRLLVPASNRKLVTAALVADAFEADTTFETILGATANPAGGTIAGDLVLEASGDPTWTPRFLGGRPGSTALGSLARQLAQRGIRQVTGDLVVDTSAFEEPDLLPPAWRWDDLDATYGAIPSVLAVNGNLGALVFEAGSVGAPLRIEPSSPVAPFEILNETTTASGGSAPRIDLRRSLDGRRIRIEGSLPSDTQRVVRSLPVGNPTEYTARLLLRELGEEGITVAGTVRLAERGAAVATVLATVDSAPMADILAECNEESDNLLAEMLYLACARERFGRASYRGAYRTEEELFKRLDIDPREVNPSDGSGLSRENAITPRALVELLRAFHDVAWFRESLPVSGRSGTLRYRLGGNGLAGRVRAKTGTLDGASSLSGYVQSRSGRTIVFSIMANNYTSSTASIRRTIDEIVDLLASN